MRHDYFVFEQQKKSDCNQGSYQKKGLFQTNQKNTATMIKLSFTSDFIKGNKRENEMLSGRQLSVWHRFGPILACHTVTTGQDEVLISNDCLWNRMTMLGRQRERQCIRVRLVELIILASDHKCHRSGSKASIDCTMIAMPYRIALKWTKIPNLKIIIFQKKSFFKFDLTKWKFPLFLCRHMYIVHARCNISR